MKKYKRLSNDEVRTMLQYVPDYERENWRNVGMALNHDGYPFEIWREWSLQDPEGRWKEHESENQWKSFKRTSGNVVTLGSIIRQAQQNGWERNTVIPAHMDPLNYVERHEEAESYSAKDPDTDITKQITKAHEDLLASPDALQHFRKRGLSDETINRFMLGYLPGGLRNAFPGIENYKKHPYAWLYKYSFPYLEKDGCVYGSFENESREQKILEKARKYYFPSGLKKQLYNVAVFQRDQIPPAVFITEGVYDALSIEQCGLPAVALGGVASGPLITALERYNVPNSVRFIVALDNDDEGNKSAEKLCNALMRKGYLSSRYTVHGIRADGSQVKDANELLMQDPEELEKQLKEAETMASSDNINEAEANGAETVATGTVANEEQSGFRGFRGFSFYKVIENKNAMTGDFAPIEPFKGAEEADLPEFNVDWLPDGLFRRYARSISNDLQVSPDMVCAALITAVSAAIQKKITICLKPGYYEPVNLYMAVIASPSERKSPTQKEIVFPFYSYEKEENMRREPLITEYRNKKKALKKLMDKTINKCVGKENADEQISSVQTQIDSLEEVTPIRLIASDITAEKLASVMKANNETLSIFDTEGGIFLIMAGLYSSKGMGSNIDIYLKSFSNDNVSIDRKNADSVVMYHPSLAMLLFAQPQVIKQIMSNREFSGRGLLARFGYVFPKSLVGGRKFYTDPIDKELRRSYEKAMHNLIQLDPQCDGFPSRTIHPCLESMSIINQYFDEVEGKLKTQYQPIESWAGKCFGQSARIAACLHAMKYQQNCVNREIDTETIINAINIEKYLTAHAFYAFSAMGVKRSEYEEAALYILEKLKQIITTNPNTPKTPNTENPIVNVQDLYQACKSKYDTRKKLNGGLNELVMRNIIRVKEIQSGDQGGRPKEIIEVNPNFMDAIPTFQSEA